MSTPKEIIEEFMEKFTYVEEGFLGSENYVSIRQDITISKLNSTIISTVIKQYEEMLGEVEGMKKSGLTKPVRKGIIGAMDINTEYNKALSDIILLLQSKLKAWRELRDNK